MAQARIQTKITFYELTVTHDLLDYNRTFQHDHRLDAEREFKALERGGFRVTMRKVTETRFETRRAERILKSNWNGR